MKWSRYKLMVLLAVGIASTIFIAGCNGSGASLGVFDLVVTPSAPGVTVGQTATVTVTAQNGSGTTVTVPANNYTWTSSNTAIVTVDNTGKITGVAPGTAQITILDTKTSVSTTVTVVVSGPAGSISATVQ